jgi:hypothetical protein
LKNKKVLGIIDQYFEQQQLSDAQIFNILRLYVYEIKAKQNSSDLHLLGKLLQPEELNSVVEYYDGDIIKMPKKSELLEATFLTICFYLKEIKGWNWLEIREFINLPEADKDLLSSISIGKQINALKETMGKDIMELIKNLDIENLQDAINGVQL